MPTVDDWIVRGSEALELFGNSHTPDGQARACALLLHGYFGYKDYGFIPVLAERLCERGVIVHRFNFAHSGMTNVIERFERPDLFKRQTWNAQVYDTLCVLNAVRQNRLPGAEKPILLIGHSRGGVTAILTAGRHAQSVKLAGVVTLAAPSACSSLPEQVARQWLQTGSLDVTSNRTGQTMPISSTWLEEQIADPEGHDVLGQAARIACPLLCVHGQDDVSVPPSHAERIVAAAAPRARLALIDGANHVFNMPNPPDPAAGESDSFVAMTRVVAGLIDACVDHRA